MRSRNAEIRNSSRPGSQAPHAPPALTFGLPGKQSVKQGQAGAVLIRLDRTLPANRNIFTDVNDSGRPGRLGWPGATFARVLPPARSDPAGNRRIRCRG